jgi:hypothetical protein
MMTVVRRPIPSGITVDGSGASTCAANGAAAPERGLVRNPVPGVSIPSVPSGSESDVNGADVGPGSSLSGPDSV